MSLWHLLWMHATGLGLVALLMAAPFVWHWARGYASAERARRRWLYQRVIRSYLASEERQAAVRARIASGARITSHRFDTGPKRQPASVPCESCGKQVDPRESWIYLGHAPFGFIAVPFTAPLTGHRFDVGPSQRPAVVRTEGELRAAYEPTEEIEEP
jgi:hypothetical protein